MDLLAGYGSGGDFSDEPDSPTRSRPQPHSEPSRPAAAQAAPKPDGGGRSGGLFSSLPAPKLGVGFGTGGGVGKKVQWKPPLKVAPVAADDDDNIPKKRPKSSKGSSLSSLLPAPKNVLGGNRGGTASLGGGGGALGGGLGEGGEGATRMSLPNDAAGNGSVAPTEYVMSRPKPAQPAAAPPQPPSYDANAMYRLDEYGNYSTEAYSSYYAAPTGTTGAAPQHVSAPTQSAYAPGPVQRYDYFPEEHRAATPYQGTIETLQVNTGTVAAVETAPVGEDVNGLALLQAELAREQQRQARMGKKAGKVPQIMNVTQEKLKYVAPSATATANAAQNAFGPQYQAQLRKEAGQKGSKVARRKHQIGTLYHNMKMAEVEAMESRSSTHKSKAETAAKYGW